MVTTLPIRSYIFPTLLNLNTLPRFTNTFGKQAKEKIGQTFSVTVPEGLHQIYNNSKPVWRQLGRPEGNGFTSAWVAESKLCQNPILAAYNLTDPSLPKLQRQLVQMKFLLVGGLDFATSAALNLTSTLEDECLNGSRCLSKAVATPMQSVLRSQGYPEAYRETSTTGSSYPEEECVV